MKHIFLPTVLCLFSLILLACAPNMSRAVRLDSYNPQGESTRPFTDENKADVLEHGMILTFDPGDEIKLRFDRVDGDLVEKIDETTIRIKQPFFFYIGPNGYRLSRDGEDFKTDVVDGSMTIGYTMDSGSRENRIMLSVDATTKD